MTMLGWHDHVYLLALILTLSVLITILYFLEPFSLHAGVISGDTKS